MLLNPSFKRDAPTARPLCQTLAVMSHAVTTDKLLYLDAEFVSRLYEAEFKVSPETKITRSESMQASASLAVFSGGGTSTESRSYGVSSVEMFHKLHKRLSQYPKFDAVNHAIGKASAYAWISGTLGISTVKVTRTHHTITLFGKWDEKAKKNREDDFIGEEAFFSLQSDTAKFALSPTDQYFTSGVFAFSRAWRV